MNSKTLLIALPFAGGNSYSYNFLKPHLAANFILETLEYPGRGKQSHKPLVSHMDILVKGLLEQYSSVLQTITPAKIVLYGHSIGSLVGISLLHEISRLMPRALPGMAIFSGFEGPGHLDKKQFSGLTDTELIGHFIKNGSLSSEIAAENELMEYILPILRNDLALYEFPQSIPAQKITIPLAIINGKDDDIETSRLDSWLQVTTGKVDLYQIDGHHFFISQNPLAFSDLIHKVITDHIG